MDEHWVLNRGTTPAVVASSKIVAVAALEGNLTANNLNGPVLSAIVYRTKSRLSQSWPHHRNGKLSNCLHCQPWWCTDQVLLFSITLCWLYVLQNSKENASNQLIVVRWTEIDMIDQ
jgi:hypothetical protein